MFWYQFVSLILACLCAGTALKRYLMMLQQNSYRADRYRQWMETSADTTSWMSLTAIIVFLLSASKLSNPVFSTGLIAAVSLTDYIILACRRYKKPLVWTPRACRIYATASLLAILTIGTVYLLTRSLLGAATIAFGVFCLAHWYILVANWLLKPVERAINSRYYRQAQEILQSMPNLKIVGITGSYGKTSTKHYLHRILSEEFDTAMTPGSFNTTLGVIRTIREHLKPYNEIFIVEMGAKQPGDIREICDLVHPSMGIVTAVGPQHLESFKTIEAVCHTKFELVNALPANGLAVINDDFPEARQTNVNNVKTLRYALRQTQNADYSASDIIYTPRGTQFTLTGPDGLQIPLETPLVGECNVSNLIAAAIVALKLGVTPESLRRAVAQIQQVEHRLSIRRTPGGVTIIDDAFNSNPTGSAMALDVLKAMTSGKRIIVTPGMIELGDKQHELNHNFGKLIAQAADIAIIVGQYNRKAITEGISDAERKIEVITVDTFHQAQTKLAPLLHIGDTVLYENDLPDTFK